MGCFLSTADGSDNIDEIIESLSYYYDEACLLDPSVGSSNASLRHSTGVVVSTLSADDRSISLDSLEEAVDDLSDVGTDASFALLELRDEIKSNPELACFVRRYFRRSVDILKFFTEFRECLRRARRIEATALDAVVCLDNNNLAGASRKLGEIIAAGDPLPKTFLNKVASVLEQQRQLRTLQDQGNKLEQNLKSSESWKTVWSVVFAISFAATLICSIVLAAVSAPPAVIAVAAAVSAAAVPLREWVDSLRKACVGKINKKKSVVKKLENGAYSNIDELKNIKEAAKNVDNRLQYLLEYAELGITYDEDAAAMKAAVVHIKATLGKFTSSIERLEKNVEECRQRLRRTTAAISKAVKDDDL